MWFILYVQAQIHEFFLKAPSSKLHEFFLNDSSSCSLQQKQDPQSKQHCKDFCSSTCCQRSFMNTAICSSRLQSSRIQGLGKNGNGGWWVVGGGHGDGDGAPEDAFWR